MYSYQRDRDEFVARMAREGLPLGATWTLLRQATTIHRLAELMCSSEAANRDQIPCPGVRPTSDGAPCLCDRPNDGHETIPRIALQDWRAEQRAIRAIADANRDLARRPSGMVAEERGQWHILTSGDPRGYTLRVIPPSYAGRNRGRDRFNLDAIGVPARPSRLQF